MELHSNSLAIVFQDFGWSKVGNKVDLIIGCWVEDLLISSHVIESSSEDNCNSISTNSQCRSGTIKRSISDTQDDNMPLELI